MLRHLRLGGVAYSAGGESGLPSFIHPTSRRETVWKVGGGFLIACVSCFKRARWDIFALFWLLAILQIEAYWDFPDSLWKGNSPKLDFRFTEFSEVCLTRGLGSPLGPFSNSRYFSRTLMPSIDRLAPCPRRACIPCASRPRR